MRIALVLALVLTPSLAQAVECPADRAIYVSDNGEKFVVERYGVVEHTGGRIPVPGRPRKKFITPVQQGTFKGRRVLNYIDTATGGTGFPGSSFVGSDPEWERLIIWKRSTKEKASDLAPSTMGEGPLTESIGRRWELKSCR